MKEIDNTLDNDNLDPAICRAPVPLDSGLKGQALHEDVRN
jgi:hypothetical protein